MSHAESAQHPEMDDELTLGLQKNIGSRSQVNHLDEKLAFWWSAGLVETVSCGCIWVFRHID